MKEYAVIYEQGETNWGAMVPDLPGCVSIGDTFEEVQENIKEAIELYLEVLQERGETIPEPTTKVGLVGVAAGGFLPTTQKLLGFHWRRTRATQSATIDRAIARVVLLFFLTNLIFAQVYSWRLAIIAGTLTYFLVFTSGVNRDKIKIMTQVSQALQSDANGNNPKKLLVNSDNWPIVVIVAVILGWAKMGLSFWWKKISFLLIFMVNYCQKSPK
jgi:predicted RNase H-like HicB family nuclease